MLSLRGYLEGHPLYSQTYTQYGPFHFFIQGLTFRLLHLPMTHDAGRLVTFLDWMLAAALGGGFVYRMSRNLLLASSAFASFAVLGAVLAKEPGHPQQTILPLFLLAALVVPGPESRFNHLRLLCLAAIGSALVFVKINFGVFYLFALAHACLTLLPQSRLRHAALACSLAGAALLPYALMHSTLAHVRHFYFFATPCLLATFAISSMLRPALPLPWRTIAWCLGGGLLAAGAIVTAAILQGISPRWLLTGVVLDPARHPHVYLTPWVIRREILAAMLLFLGGSTAVAWLSLRGRLKAYADLIQALPGAAGMLAAVLLLSARLGVTGEQQNAAWALCLLPLGMIGTAGGDGRAWFPRVFLAGLAATEFLGAYPVAGSQVAIGAAPALLWAFVCIIDGGPGLAAALRRLGPIGKDVLVRATPLVLLAACAMGAWLAGFRSFQYPGPSSKLAGMHSLHLKPAVERRYEFLTASVRANCDLLFSMPGMGSFNFWSGLPMPDGNTVGVWLQVMSQEKQGRILKILQGDPRACVISNAEVLEDWHTTPETIAESPLAQYILRMPVVAESGQFQVHAALRRDPPWAPVAFPGGEEARDRQ